MNKTNSTKKEEVKAKHICTLQKCGFECLEPDIKEEECKGTHCRCMNLDGCCPRIHYADCKKHNPYLSSTPPEIGNKVEEWTDEYCRKFGLCNKDEKCQCKGEINFIKELLSSQRSKEPEFHSTCETCHSLIPNKHFECERNMRSSLLESKIEEIKKLPDADKYGSSQEKLLSESDVLSILSKKK